MPGFYTWLLTKSAILRGFHGIRVQIPLLSFLSRTAFQFLDCM